MDSIMRRNIFLTAIVAVLLFIVIWYFIKSNKDKSSKDNIIIADVPPEVMQQVLKVDAEEVSKKAPDASSFPLELGSTGDNVRHLQSLLGLKETGTLDKKTLDAFKYVTKDIGLVDNSKVSQSSVILLENYTKPISRVIIGIGDTVYASLPKVVIERVNVKRDRSGSIGKIQPTRDYKGFSKGDRLGIVSKIVNDSQVLVKNGFGDYFLTRMDAISKK